MIYWDNSGEETGKLRETCSYFLVAYFFPGSEVESSVVPAKMVEQTFSHYLSTIQLNHITGERWIHHLLCYRLNTPPWILHHWLLLWGRFVLNLDWLAKVLAQAILISGEWLLDIACGSRQLSVAALERGRFLWLQTISAPTYIFVKVCCCPPRGGWPAGRSWQLPSHHQPRGGLHLQREGRNRLKAVGLVGPPSSFLLSV